MSLREEVLTRKKSKVENLTQEVESSDALFFTEYSGLSVHQIETLRGTLRESSA